MKLGYLTFSVDLELSSPPKIEDIKLFAYANGLSYEDIPGPISDKTAFVKAIARIVYDHRVDCKRAKNIKNHISYALEGGGLASWTSHELEFDTPLAGVITAAYNGLCGTTDNTAWGKAITKFMSKRGCVPVRTDGRVWWTPPNLPFEPAMLIFSQALEMAGIFIVHKAVEPHDLSWLVPKVLGHLTVETSFLFNEVSAFRNLRGQYLERRQAQLIALTGVLEWLKLSGTDYGPTIKGIDKALQQTADRLTKFKEMSACQPLDQHGGAITEVRTND